MFEQVIRLAALQAFQAGMDFIRERGPGVAVNELELKAMEDGVVVRMRRDGYLDAKGGM